MKIISHILLLVTLSIQRQTFEPEKSPNDNRLYQHVTLENELKILFVQDKFIEKSACAICVGVGSLYEPDSSPGLAHFLEHMLFMGSKKYPGENEHDSFIFSNSGRSNAFTQKAITNYYLQIKNSLIFNASERLINFFISPLLKSESISKQINAVENQFKINSGFDEGRRNQILVSFADKPYGRFSAGNKNTLDYPTVRDDLVQFYNKYYSSNLMTAVVYSNYSIEAMKQRLIPLFEQIPNKRVTLPNFDLFYHNRNDTRKFIRMQSMKDENLMTFYWSVEYLPKYSNKHIMEYFQYVVGHEGQNSLLSTLKVKSYASGLEASGQNMKVQSQLSINIKLTKRGYQNYQQVYNIVMDYINNLKSQQHIYNEIKQKNTLQFNFLEKTAAYLEARNLATLMQTTPIPNILNASIQFESYYFSSIIINKIFASLRQENLILFLSGLTQLDQPLEQQYFGTKYELKKLPSRKRSSILFDELPINSFIPINTTLIDISQKLNTIPFKLTQNMYFLGDSSFKVSKGGIQLRIYNSQTPQFLSFYSAYLSFLLKQIIYPAESFSSSVTISSENCLVINIFGFRDTVIKVIQKISESFYCIHVGQRSYNIFQIVKSEFIESLRNFYNSSSLEIATTLMDILLVQGRLTPEKLLDEYKDYNYESLNQRAYKIWKNNFLRWVIVGNFDVNKTLQTIQRVKPHFLGKRMNVKVPEQRALKLKQNIIHAAFLESKVETSTTIIYYQAGPYMLDLLYKLFLLKDYAYEPYYNELRTNKKIAYSLSISVTNTRGIVGLKFTLVSSTHDPKSISNQIKKFANSFFGSMQQKLQAKNGSRFNQLKQSLMTNLKQQFKSLDTLFQFVNKEIIIKAYNFTKRQPSEIKKVLDPITISSLQQLWQKMKSFTAEIYAVSQVHQSKYQQYNIQPRSLQQIKQKSEFWDDALSQNI